MVTAQKRTFTTKWSTSPFDNNLFIENKGQFNGELPGNNRILYKAQLGKIAVYFTPEGVVYRYSEVLHPENDNIKSNEKEADRQDPVNHYLYADWVGAEQATVVSADEEQSYYYTYPSGKNNTIKTSVYKKLIYRNLYTGIDAEYIFPDKKTGIKYSLIVHPGADITKAKLEYKGANSIREDADGNVVISSDVGVITDHAPVSYYTESTTVLPTKYRISGAVESFYVTQGYDKNKTIVIDPWTSSTSFSGINAAFDLDYDKYGNVYAYGGESNTSVTQLVKITSTGVKQWVFNATTISGTSDDCYGDIATDKNSGTTYILQGFRQGIILKVSSFGSLANTYPGSGIVNEYWRADFDQCHHMLIIGAGGTSNPYQAATVDTNFTTFTPVNIEAATLAFHDITLMTLDPYSNSCFMATAGHPLSDTIYGVDELCKMPLPLLSPTTYKKKDGFNFIEVESVPYTGNIGVGEYNTNAMNGAAASPSWLYLYNGDTLKRFNKTTGAVSTQVALTATPYRCGGLDVDACDNVYAGCNKSIQVYNAGLSLQSTISLPDTVYDVHLGSKNVLLACGKDFVTAISITGTKNITTTITYPSSCYACDGSATAQLACGTAGPYNFLWSNGSTSQTATGLCAGIYTVTATYGSPCSPAIDSATVVIPGKPGYTASVIDTDATCTETGSSTAFPAGGTSPYTYNWSNGVTTQYDPGLTSGMYTCIITDSNGCKYTVSTSIPPLVLPNLYITPPVDSVCNGTVVPLQVFGANSYTWAPSTGLSCTNCPNPVASPTVNTSYTVTGTSSMGCVGKDSVTIAFSAPPNLSVVTYPQGCTDTYLEGFGASGYIWRPSNDVTCSTCEYTTAYFYAATTFTLVGTSHGCSDSTTITVVPSTLLVTLKASSDTVCIGDSVKLTALVNAVGIKNYYWSVYGGPCNACSSIYVKPTATTFYTVQVVDSAGCSSGASIGIYVEGITIGSSTNCIQTYLTANGSTSGYTWQPSTGLSCTACQSTTATPSSTTTYTVTGTSSGGCGNSNTIVVKVDPPPTVNLTASTKSICAGDSVKLTAITSGTNLKYYWYPNTGSCTACSVVYVKPAVTTKYTIEVNDSIRGCYAVDTVTISVGGIGIESSSYNCGETTYLYAAGSSSGYTWAPSAGLSCTSCQYPIATPTVTTTYTVTGTGGGNCGNSRTVVVSPSQSSFIASIKATPDTICAGGSVLLSASGKGITSYYWSSLTGGVSCPNCQNTQAYPGGTSVYSLVVYDSVGCSFDTTFTIYVSASVTVSSTAEYCYGAVDLHASGAASYIWSPPAGLSCTACANPFATPTVNTTYTVTAVGTSCPNGSTSASISVAARPAPSTSCCNTTMPIGQSVSLTATGTAGSSYIWSPSAGLSCYTCADPVASPNVTTIYTVTVTNDSGCASATTLLIDITCGTVFVPSAFSPNGDGQNDRLYVRGDCIQSIEFWVFDRWGNVVFKTTDKTIGWNGVFDGQPANTGTYVYYLNATMYDGSKQTKKGDVTLVR